MRHQVDHRKLGRSTSHRKALLRNMASSLILAERIETTLPKAKELSRLADNLVTFAKEGTLHTRRLAARTVLDQEALKKLFDILGPRFKDRQGGYTRIFKFGFRLGDGAPMAAIEYLGYQLPVKAKPGDKEEKKEKKAKEPKKVKVEKKAEKPKKEKEKKEPAKKAKKEEKGKTEKKKSDKKGKWGLFGG